MCKSPYTQNQEALCWTCRRSDGDKAINPDGYCSWIAETQLPKGCKVLKRSCRDGRVRRQQDLVVGCPLYKRYGLPTFAKERKHKSE